MGSECALSNRAARAALLMGSDSANIPCYFKNCVLTWGDFSSSWLLHPMLFLKLRINMGHSGNFEDFLPHVILRFAF